MSEKADDMLNDFLRPVPEGWGRCTACGNPLSLAKTRRDPARYPDKRRDLSFTVEGCRCCGHIMRWTETRYVDLTRAQAEELRESPAWKRVRHAVETFAVADKWG